jgi:NAD(P)-dependent dehydrogenase (short-subunit alcohol dehydrogenase family)
MNRERAMQEFRFDGRTAIVTGAGGNPSLGRAHALLLAERGANVVVNDIGHDPESGAYYRDKASADAVVAEIRARGGIAVADTHSVAGEEGAGAIVQTALDAFGGVDIVVNNAVITVIAPFDEMSSKDFRRHIETNLMGPIWLCRAAWPHMRAQRYGRIVNLASGAFTGCSLMSAYGISKGGLFSLTCALAAEGEAIGIKANTVNPTAYTRGSIASINEDTTLFQHFKNNSPAEFVSPVVAYLAHEKCPVSGECIEAGAGSLRRVYVAGTPGVTQPRLTIEGLAENWDRIVAGAGNTAIKYGVSAAENFRTLTSEGTAAASP